MGSAAARSRRTLDAARGTGRRERVDSRGACNESRGEPPVRWRDRVMSTAWRLGASMQVLHAKREHRVLRESTLS